MADKSAIEWTDATWNPIVGCSIKSSGCAHCYAMRQALRQELMAAGQGGESAYKGLTIETKAGPVWTGEVRLVEHLIDLPLRWKRPRTIFVNSMGDLFHEDVPLEWIDSIVVTMALVGRRPPTERHVFQVLTKRADVMVRYFREIIVQGRLIGDLFQMTGPMPHVWLGFSAERQHEFDERWNSMRHLAAQGWTIMVSIEPMLGPIILPSDFLALGARACVIVGGESGPKARPMHPAWARSIRDQCAPAGVPFFFKQWGEWHADSLLYTEAVTGLCPPPGMKIGKRRSGRLLDGRTHDELPRSAA